MIFNKTDQYWIEKSINNDIDTLQRLKKELSELRESYKTTEWVQEIYLDDKCRDIENNIKRHYEMIGRGYVALIDHIEKPKCNSEDSEQVIIEIKLTMKGMRKWEN